MGIQVIAMDMDGTLLRSDNTISERTKKALIDAQKQGIRLVLASGRSYRKLIQYALELEMDTYGGYLIEVNGTALYNVLTQERIVKHQLYHEQLVEIFDTLLPYEVEIIGIADDALYDYIPNSMMEDKRAYRKLHKMSEDHPWTAGAFDFICDNRVGYPKQYTIQKGSEFPTSLNKISIAHHASVLQTKIPAIRQALSDRYWLGLTSPGWLEIMKKGVTKGSSIQDLVATLNIPIENVMAFGDGENDIEMLECVGYGVAMENALPNVLEKAQYICADHNHDGIAQTIEKLILSK